MSNASLSLESLEERYEYAAIATSTEERNQAFRKADGANMPVVWLLPRKKYGCVRSDMITAPSQVDGLDRSAHDRVAQLNEKYMKETLNRSTPSHRPDVWATTGHICPGIDGILLDDMAAYADALLEIIYDQSNWDYR